MKFAALTLTLLLVVGSQAASLQNEEIKEVTEIAAMRTKFEEFNSELSDTLEGNAYKDQIVQSVTDVEERILKWSKVALSVATDASEFLYMSTSPIHETIKEDITDLEKQLQPKYNDLHSTLTELIKNYEAQIKAIWEEHVAEGRTETDGLGTKLNVVFMKMGEDVKETNNAIQSILESVKNWAGKTFSEIKKFVGPNVIEFREQIKDGVKAIKSFSVEDTSDIQEKIMNPIINIGNNLKSLFGNIGEIFKSN